MIQLPSALLLEKPNYERIISVLWREEPDRVPFYEHLVDIEVIEYLLNVKLKGLDLSKKDHKIIYP